MSLTTPRFGIWAPVEGRGQGRYHQPDVPTEVGFQHLKDTVIAAEKLGYESTLLALHTMRTGNPDIVEPWTAAAAVAAVTSRIEIITAVKARLFHPVVFAKLFLGVEDISEGRAGINFVNSFIKAEIEQAGIPFDEHDDRYAYGTEWLHIVRALISGETVNFQGKYFNVTDYALRPASRHRARPRIYSGGESEPGRVLVSTFSDGWFLQGQPVQDIKVLVDDLRRRPRTGAPLRYLLSSYVITRETDEEAEDVLQRRLAAQAEQWKQTEARFKDPKFIDTNAVVFQRMLKRGQVLGGGGGTGSKLIGSYDRVARRILEFVDVGIDEFMLQFQPLNEQEAFAHEVIPRVRALALKKAA